MKKLYLNIKKLCAERNINITKLEKELGVSGGLFSRLQHGKGITLEKVIQVADYFNVSLDDLVGRNEKYSIPCSLDDYETLKSAVKEVLKELEKEHEDYI